MTKILEALKGLVKQIEEEDGSKAKAGDDQVLTAIQSISDRLEKLEAVKADDPPKQQEKSGDAGGNGPPNKVSPDASKGNGTPDAGNSTAPPASSLPGGGAGGWNAEMVAAATPEQINENWEQIQESMRAGELA